MFPFTSATCPYRRTTLGDPEKLESKFDLHLIGTLDFTQPIALMLLGVVNYVMNNDESQGIVNRLLDAMTSGSYLVMSHSTAEVRGEAVEESMRHWNESGAAPIRTRSAIGLRFTPSVQPNLCHRTTPGTDGDPHPQVARFRDKNTDWSREKLCWASVSLKAG